MISDVNTVPIGYTMAKKFYVTTPIYYATAAPHLGTLYSTVLADVAARWHKIQAHDVFFLTGTDEFGQKVAQAAQAAGMEPKAFVDQYIGAYKDLWKNYHIEYSHFMRTTDHYHVQAVQQWIEHLQKKGDIYKGSYQGWYCTPCETYLTPKDIQQGVEVPPCISCERPTKLIKEESYFFKLSAYQETLLAFLEEHPEFITPKERAAEVISFIKSGLQDVSISRTTLTWGVPFPGDDAHVTYVWADALNNYITAIGYGQKDKEASFKKWWPADVQVMGKDILRFHAVYWPAFLMASGLPLPHQLLVHGWIKVGDYKMSKSRGNSIDPQALLSTYGADAVRYYLARHLAITQDGQFSIEDLEKTITSDLANDLGNLLNRLLVLAEKNNLLTLPVGTWTAAEHALQEQLQAIVAILRKEMDRGFFHLALAALAQYTGQLNSYFHAQEPWKLAKTDKHRCATVLSATAHGLAAIAPLLWPVMPHKMEELLACLGQKLDHTIDYVARADQAVWHTTYTLHKGPTLFEKPEPKDQSCSASSTEKTSSVEKKDDAQNKSESYIAIDDVMKVDMRVGTIINCVEVAGSDKLLLLTVDFAEQQPRTIFSGIKKYYQPEELIGQQAVFVVNLKPRKMMGQESQGMLLCAQSEGAFSYVKPQRPVANGSKLS